MAEGDVVHRTALRLERALRGCPVRAVASPHPRAGLSAASERLVGRQLERAQARGKHILLRFGADAILHSHLGMQGAWHSYQHGGRWRRSRSSAWLVLTTEESDVVQFGGPTMALIDEAHASRHPSLAALGPDVLAPGFEPRRGAAELRTTDPSRSLGEAMLDQRLLAGIGNIYKSEGCFVAGVSPWRALCELTDEELVRVVAATRDLMLSGLRNARRPRLIYRRARRPCPRCGSPIQAGAQGDAARITYWCVRCQG